jgi:hypothetical protein
VFAAARKLNSSAFTKNRWMKMAGYIGLFLVVAGITVFFIFKKMKYH